MLKNLYRLWIPVLALGWLFDLLFWEKSLGINFPIFWVVSLVVSLALLLSEGKRPHRNALFLIPIFIFFAAVSMLRAEPMTLFLAWLFTMFSLALFTATYQGGRWFLYSLADYAFKYLILLGSMVFRAITFTADARKAQAKADAKPQRYQILPVVRGFMIAFPIVAVFAILLASADAVFNQKLVDLFNLFRLEKLPEYLYRFFIILIISNFLAGIILHAAVDSRDEKLAGMEKPLIPPFFGFIEAAIVLGSVVALFTAFVVIQFQYFFGGSANISIEGFTYAEYARRGFGELVVVAFFALLMLLALSSVTRRETDQQRNLFTGLGVALVTLLLVMLVSAYQRLSLYEAAYGFSRLRTYTHVFLVWIGLLLVATIMLEFLRKTRSFALAMLAASLGFAMSLPILNVDAFIVRQNIRRELQGTAVNELDTQYFTELSDDAVPALVTATRDSALPSSVREEIGAALACFQYERKTGQSQIPWQSFTFARLNANRALASVSEELAAYQFMGSNWPKSAVGPSGRVFRCQQNILD